MSLAPRPRRSRSTAVRSISPGSKPSRASGRPVALDDVARAAVRASRQVVDAAVARGDVVYGVTTGFGKLADVAHPATTGCASCR